MSDDTLPAPPGPSPGDRVILRLYVAGSTPQSSRAITNIKTICETHLADRFDLTVVDLYEQEEQAKDDQIRVAADVGSAMAAA